jgi:tetratricopeptide (TPR) repeat protein
LNDFKSAEKFIKKQIKRNSGNQSLAAHLGHIYKLTGADEKAKKTFNEAIENLESNQGAIIGLSQTFYKYKETDYVIKTLLAGKKLMRGVYPFNMELADAYNAKGDYASMYKEYLEALTLSDAYLVQIQNILQSYQQHILMGLLVQRIIVL